MSISQLNYVALTTGLFVLAYVRKNSILSTVQYGIGHTRSQFRTKYMPADEKARSGSMLAGGIVSRKL